VPGPAESARAVEDVWRGMFDAYKKQSEAQFREFRVWVERMIEMGSHGNAAGPHEQPTRQ
jgi:hypothetical protein